MVIVQGIFEVLPEERSVFLDARLAVIRASREEDGCQEYVLAPDPIEPGRVIISERWESMGHLQRHLDRLSGQSSEPSREALPQPLNVHITLYEVAASKRLR